MRGAPVNPELLTQLLIAIMFAEILVLTGPASRALSRQLSRPGRCCMAHGVVPPPFGGTAPCNTGLAICMRIDYDNDYDKDCDYG
jgi:hypothetical protein